MIDQVLHALKRLIILPILIATSVSLYADWIPSACLVDLEPETFNILNDSKFKALKVKVSNALKETHCSEEKLNLLMELVYLTNPQICVEIGAFTGSSVLPVAATLQTLNQGKIYAIDAWSNQEAIKGLADDDPNKPWWASVSMKDIKSLYDQTIRRWKLNPVVITLHSTSEKAINQLPEIDFLHLDGNFSEEGALKDVQLYLPKVKEGGYILISNLYVTVNGNYPKFKAFRTLFDTCEMVCEIEKGNAVLLKKQKFLGKLYAK